MASVRSLLPPAGVSSAPAVLFQLTLFREEQVGRHFAEPVADLEIERLGTGGSVCRPEVLLFEPAEAAVGTLVAAVELNVPGLLAEVPVRDPGIVLQDGHTLRQ